MTSWTWVATFISAVFRCRAFLPPPQPVRQSPREPADWLADWRTARHRFARFFGFRGFLAPFVRQSAGSPADSAFWNGPKPWRISENDVK